MIPIIWITTSAAVTCPVIQVMACDNCDTDNMCETEMTGYGSVVTFYGLGDTSAPKKARKKARQDLEQKLESHVDLVPCPSCGHYQQAMVEEYASVVRRQWTKSLWACFLQRWPQRYWADWRSCPLLPKQNGLGRANARSLRRPSASSRQWFLERHRG